MSLKKFSCVAPILFILNTWQLFPQENSYLLTSGSRVDPHFGNSDVVSTGLVVDVDLVNVPFTVKDDEGRLVNDVDPASLKIYEDNRLQAIRYFSHEVNFPLTIGLLVDTSNSINERWSFERTTALEFTRSFESISTELRSQFSLAYSSTNPRRDGVFRKIRIESKHRKWIVRTRKGYFAPAG